MIIIDSITLTRKYYTDRELAQWFQMELPYFIAQRKIRLEELKHYAEFEEKQEGVDIKKILIPIYFPFDLPPLYEEYKYAVYLSSIASIIRKLEKQGPLSHNVSPKTMQRRLINARNRLYGDPNDKENADDIWNRGGRIGWCRYIWAIKEDDYNHYRYLTDEEVEQFESFWSDEKNASSQMNEKSFLSQGFGKAIRLFKAATGLQIVRVTEHCYLISGTREE